MVKAILDGRKTVTRRVIKPQFPTYQDREHGHFSGINPHGKGSVIATHEEKPNMKTIIPLPYMPGDILYVRETWTKLYYVDTDGYTHYDQPMYYYAADGTPDITLIDPDGFEKDDQLIRWTPSIHMPKKAARIWLRVTDVRVEKLRDITEEGAVKEGLYKGWRINGRGSPAVTARQAFMWLWETLTKKSPAYESWACNPWVWVIEFERCEKPEGKEKEK